MYICKIMSNNFGYIDIILLAMIAGFIILRLRNILGRKTGHESKIYTDFNEKRFETINKKNINVKEVRDVLEGQDKKEFLKGAEIAYETIITSFAKGDKKKLEDLLTKQMSSNFYQAIEERNRLKISSDLTFIGIKQSNLEKYEKVKTNLFATVKFVSEIISVKKDANNKIIEGNPDRIKTVTDHWKFTKNVLLQSQLWDKVARKVTVMKPTVNDVANTIKIDAADVGIAWDVISHQYDALDFVELKEFNDKSKTVTLGHTYPIRSFKRPVWCPAKSSGRERDKRVQRVVGMSRIDLCPHTKPS